MKKILKEILSVLNQLLDEVRVHNTAEMRDKEHEDDTVYDENFSFRIRKWLKANAQYEDENFPSPGDEEQTISEQNINHK
tara:strand:+ start:523 stop:762 length:240 start_codon:yes stop_codon:yes gene_type:complete